MGWYRAEGEEPRNAGGRPPGNPNTAAAPSDGGASAQPASAPYRTTTVHRRPSGYPKKIFKTAPDLSDESGLLWYREEIITPGRRPNLAHSA